MIDTFTAHSPDVLDAVLGALLPLAAACGTVAVATGAWTSIRIAGYAVRRRHRRGEGRRTRAWLRATLALAAVPVVFAAADVVMTGPDSAALQAAADRATGLPGLHWQATGTRACTSSCLVLTADVPDGEVTWSGSRQVLVSRHGWTRRTATITVAPDTGQSVRITAALEPVTGPVISATNELRTWWQNAPQHLAALAP